MVRIKVTHVLARDRVALQHGLEERMNIPPRGVNTSDLLAGEIPEALLSLLRFSPSESSIPPNQVYHTYAALTYEEL